VDEVRLSFWCQAQQAAVLLLVIQTCSTSDCQPLQECASITLQVNMALDEVAGHADMTGRLLQAARSAPGRMPPAERKRATDLLHGVAVGWSMPQMLQKPVFLVLFLFTLRLCLDLGHTGLCLAYSRIRNSAYGCGYLHGWWHIAQSCSITGRGAMACPPAAACNAIPDAQRMWHHANTPPLGGLLAAAFPCHCRRHGTGCGGMRGSWTQTSAPAVAARSKWCARTRQAAPS
jgi:hypothetical protein